MHEWEGLTAGECVELMGRRDPLRHRLLLFTGSPWPEPKRVHVAWFRENVELADYLVRIEVARHVSSPADALGLKDALAGPLTAVSVTGLDEALRQGCNAVTAPLMGVIWWGSLERLKSADEPWPRALREKFHCNGDGRPLADRETRAFLGMLRERYCRSDIPEPDAPD